MSQAVQIDYRQIQVQCDSVCELAEQRLKELDELLAQLDQSSTRLHNEQSRALREEILATRAKLFEQIEAVRKKAAEDARMGLVKTNNHDARVQHMNDTINAANALSQQINQLSSEGLVQMRALLDSLLSENLSQRYQSLVRAANGEISLSTIQSILDSINDAMLRQFVILAYLNDTSLSGQALIAAGQALMEHGYEARIEQEQQRIRAELEAARIDPAVVEEQVSGETAQERLATMQAVATQEIVGEKVRQKSLRIIIKAIQARGFVVDKKNIRIQRDTNEVVLVALKASGERAEFHIYMDGKFVYDFHGYQGQACQKDIEPFMHDLEEVYGMHIVSQQEVWSNPDRDATMKYQIFNTNKNKR